MRQININLKFTHNIFNFKWLLEKPFKGANLSISLHLDNIKELTDVEDIKHILERFHITEFAGHSGSQRMYNTIRQFFRWTNMKRDIDKYVSDCAICEKTKIVKHSKVPLQITSTTHTIIF